MPASRILTCPSAPRWRPARSMPLRAGPQGWVPYLRDVEHGLRTDSSTPLCRSATTHGPLQGPASIRLGQLARDEAIPRLFLPVEALEAPEDGFLAAAHLGIHIFDLDGRALGEVLIPPYDAHGAAVRALKHGVKFGEDGIEQPRLEELEQYERKAEEERVALEQEDVENARREVQRQEAHERRGEPGLEVERGSDDLVGKVWARALGEVVGGQRTERSALA